MRRLLVLLAALVSGAVFATPVSKPEVTVEVPEGWVEVPPDVLQAFFDELKRQAPTAQIPKYNYAFQSTQGPPWLSYPYVLVKVTPSGRPTEHDLESLPSIDLNAKVREQNDDMRKLLKDSSLGQMNYDKVANIVWLGSKTDVANIGLVTGISGVIPTEQGFVELHAYAKAGDFPEHLPTFQKIITSARIAPHLAYRPHWTDKLGPLAHFDFKQLGFVLVIGALVGIFVGIYRRKRS